MTQLENQLFINLKKEKEKLQIQLTQKEQLIQEIKEILEDFKAKNFWGKAMAISKVINLVLTKINDLTA